MASRRKSRFPAELGEKIFSARTAAGLSQVALAHAAGCSPLSILDYEHGRAVPRADTLKALALALRTSADALLGIGKP